MLREFLSQTAQETSQGLHMKLRNHICSVALLGVAFALLFAGSNALGQALQPPFMAPTPPSLNYGAFFLSAGVKFRSIRTFRITVDANSLSIGDPGVPAWGPNAPGTVQYPYDAAIPLPTGNAADPANISGIWVYDDGQINPVAAVAPLSTFTPPEIALGHYNVPPSNVGFFTVSDPVNQTDNAGGIYSETTDVTFSKRLNGVVVGTAGVETASRIFKADVGDGPSVNFDERIWAPYIEFGVQYSNYFDLIFASSWFNKRESVSATVPASVVLQRRGFRDTFSFESTNTTQNWLGNFSSDIPNPNADPDTTQTYVIFPVGRATGTGRPTRTFFVDDDPNVPPTAAVDQIFDSFDLTVIEFKMGGRSSAPLWGLGQWSLGLGMLLSPMPYTVVTNHVVTATANNAAAGITAGDVLINTAIKQSDVFWFNPGLYVSSDLTMGNTGYFLNWNVEYDAYFNEKSYGDTVENHIDLSGWSSAIGMGIRF
jgi:hypothetical protein